MPICRRTSVEEVAEHAEMSEHYDPGPSTGSQVASRDAKRVRTTEVGVYHEHLVLEVVANVALVLRNPVRLLAPGVRRRVAVEDV